LVIREGPESAVPLAPVDEALVSSLTPTLSWEVGPLAQHVYVSIFRRSAGINHEMVFHVMDPTGTALVVPVDTLVSATEYSWNVVTENVLGFAYSQPRVFFTETSCPADFDENGVVAVIDFFAFLSAWFADDPRADFNGNGTREVADIFAFLAAWFAANC